MYCTDVGDTSHPEHLAPSDRLIGCPTAPEENRREQEEVEAEMKKDETCEG